MNVASVEERRNMEYVARINVECVVWGRNVACVE